MPPVSSLGFTRNLFSIIAELSQFSNQCSQKTRLPLSLTKIYIKKHKTERVYVVCKHMLVGSSHVTNQCLHNKYLFILILILIILLLVYPQERCYLRGNWRETGYENVP